MGYMSLALGNSNPQRHPLGGGDPGKYTGKLWICMLSLYLIELDPFNKGWMGDRPGFGNEVPCGSEIPIQFLGKLRTDE